MIRISMRFIHYCFVPLLINQPKINCSSIINNDLYNSIVFISNNTKVHYNAYLVNFYFCFIIIICFVTDSSFSGDTYSVSFVGLSSNTREEVPSTICSTKRTWVCPVGVLGANLRIGELIVLEPEQRRMVVGPERVSYLILLTQ